ncbi:MAG: DUF3253 domain-containing protein [Pseudomonadota bacterium]
MFDTDDSPSVDEIKAALLDFAQRRQASFCPSEVARSVSEDWRPLMPKVRRVASRLQRDGFLAATQGGAPVDAASARGPIRLSRPEH